MNSFQAALHRRNACRPPVWFMRQAGRYHSHYQDLRTRHSFVDLCKQPELSCATALGPMHEFGFDAAILFSDILFPLESLGLPLAYDPAPTLGWHLRTAADLSRLLPDPFDSSSLRFQADALRLLRQSLPDSQGVLGFVGGPTTLFVYAVEGSHFGDLASAFAGLADGRFEGFLDHVIPVLARTMAEQVQAGADTIAILDTSAGAFPAEVFQSSVVPALRRLLCEFHRLQPNTPVTYYSKHTGPSHWSALRELPIACLGIDWRHDIAEVLEAYSEHWSVQGNIDPHWLLEPVDSLEDRLRPVFAKVRDLPEPCRRAWICGLGHGVLPGTPEASIHKFLQLQHEYFG